MPDEDDVDAPYFLLNFGFRDFIRKKLPVPVIAWPGKTLWRVLMHGHGFTSDLDPPLGRITGFYITHLVSAKTRLEAFEKAVRTATDRWKSTVPGARSKGKTIIEVEEVEEIDGSFRWRAASGYAYYGAD